MDDATHRLDDPAALAELIGLASPSEAARALASEGGPPRALLERLADGGHFPDAVKLLALAMPRREAVWWACRCCRDAAGDDEPPASVAALEAAERWAADPTEANRRASQAAAERAGLEHPAGCAAMGAFFGGGSLAPPGVPEVPPAPHLTAHVAAGAVMLRAVRRDPEKAPESYRAFIALGLAVADGADRPPSAPEPPAPAPAPAEHAPRPPEPPGLGGRWDEEPTRPAAPAEAARAPAPSPPRTRRWDEWE